jgi:hypothetical protein
MLSANRQIPIDMPKKMYDQRGTTSLDGLRMLWQKPRQIFFSHVSLMQFNIK